MTTRYISNNSKIIGWHCNIVCKNGIRYGTEEEMSQRYDVMIRYIGVIVLLLRSLGIVEYVWQCRQKKI
jgi:hypothetical protein